MYRKATCFLVMGSFVFMACFLCLKGIDVVKLWSEPVLELGLQEVEEKAEELEMQWEHKMRPPFEDRIRGLGIADVAVSGQRTVGYSVMEQNYVYRFSEEELEVLLRIVEAEAGNEDEDGKLLVANVVLNRLNSEQFPNTVREVVFQQEKGVSQFSPVSNGSYYRVEISEETVSAVERALLGEDLSEGALYFAARKYADSNKMKWFDRNLTYLFIHGGHEFFK